MSWVSPLSVGLRGDQDEEPAAEIMLDPLNCGLENDFGVGLVTGF